MKEYMINAEIAERKSQIDEINSELFGNSIGVYEAISRLRQDLENIDNELAERNFHKSSQLGYGDVTSNFIFLQRTLGALQNAYDNKTKLVSSIAFETKCAYEEVEPYVDKHLSSLEPRKDHGYTEDELLQMAQDRIKRLSDFGDK